MRHKITACMLLLCILFSSCDTRETTDDVQDFLDLAKTADVTINIADREFPVEDDDTREAFLDAIRNLEYENIESLSYTKTSDWEIEVDGPGAEDKTFSRVATSEGWKITAGSGYFFSESKALSDLIGSQISKTETETKEENAEEVLSTAECAEPVTDEEFVSCASDCLYNWFDGDATVVDEYGGKQKTAYLASGMVDGRKEFAVEFCFDVLDNEYRYEDLYQEGRYTAAGTYWSGYYLCGRFAWEDGMVKFLRYGTRDSVDFLCEGLNGIIEDSDSEYKTFFDFARRPDLNEVTKQNNTTRYDYTVASSVTQTMEGDVFGVEIYPSGYLTDNGNGTYTAIWYESGILNGEVSYSTGLYFTDDGTGHTEDTLPQNFDLTFDNYDGDGNPDFCCRYMEDEDGTYYTLQSIESDGRIFRLSGRAYEGGIYVAGCTEASPRLQRTEDISYVGWKKDGDRYYPTDEYGYETELPDLNMYSDRLYLPDDLRKYSEDEDTIHCFLWNNTADKITTGDTYSIEIQTGEDQYETVAENLKAKEVTIDPRGYADIEFDISKIEDRKNAYYRIVLPCGDNIAYGTFICEGSTATTVEAAPVTLGSCAGTIQVQNIGTDTLSIDEIYIDDGLSEYELTMLSDTTYFINDMPKEAGTYELCINGEITCPIEITDNQTLPNINIDFEIKNKTLTTNITPDSDITLISIYVYTDDTSPRYTERSDEQIKEGQTRTCDLTLSESVKEKDVSVAIRYEYNGMECYTTVR